MAYLNLIVKGNKLQAAEVARSWGIPFAFSQETSRGETIGTCPVTCEQKVTDWYQQPGSIPYKPGTLLVWSRVP